MKTLLMSLSYNLVELEKTVYKNSKKNGDVSRTLQKVKTLEMGKSEDG